jgi:PadR family transcriptional regulator, regulatory protein AphA
MSLRYALLGLLRKTSLNGYALKTIFDESIAFVWPAELSQIYRELEGLEKDGFLESSIEMQENRPNKRLYRSTEAGRRHLQEWLEAPPERFSAPKREEFLLRLFFGSATDPEIVKKEFRLVMAQARESLAAIDASTRLAERFPDRPYMVQVDRFCREDRYNRFIRKRGIMAAEMVIAWAEECLAELESQADVR